MTDQTKHLKRMLDEPLWCANCNDLIGYGKTRAELYCKSCVEKA